jgi:SulP family sulfate permease
VTVGFTCGIAVTIFASQIKDLGGLKLPAAEPGPLLPKLVMLGQALPSVTPTALAIGVGSAVLIFLLRRLLPNWPEC